MHKLYLPLFLVAAIVGCKPAAKSEQAAAAAPSATLSEAGFKPGCEAASADTPDGCGGPSAPKPEPKPAPEPKEPKEPKPSEPKAPKDPRGDVLKVEGCGFQCVKVTARCHNGNTGTGSAANGNEARDQAFRDCSD